uniref:Uncharacterized protein n=1 Tax=Solanum lycopersicum TaxID=4081 RepID=A0A3Q7G3H4_SOLLC
MNLVQVCRSHGCATIPCLNNVRSSGTTKFQRGADWGGVE